METREKLKLLLVGWPVLMQPLEAQLGKQFDIIRVKDEKEAENLFNSEFDAAILQAGYFSWPVKGDSFVWHLKKRYPGIAVILLTARDGGMINFTTETGEFRELDLSSEADQSRVKAASEGRLNLPGSANVADICLETEELTLETLAQMTEFVIDRKKNASGRVQKKMQILGPEILWSAGEINFYSIVARPHVQRCNGLLKDWENVSTVVYCRPEKPEVVKICLACCVGCGGRCLPCDTGKNDPFVRKLSVGEIVCQANYGVDNFQAQGVLEGKKQVVYNFACVGDAVKYNLENSCEAVLVIDRAELALKPSYIFTSIGDAAKLDEFIEKYLPLEPFASRCRHDWSLYSLNKNFRKSIIPASARDNEEEIFGRHLHIAKTTGNPFRLGWPVIVGQNDSERDVEDILRLVGDNWQRCLVRLTALQPNSLPGVNTVWQDVINFSNLLEKYHIPHVVRDIIGSSDYAAWTCGKTRPKRL